ncbi:hypothetical protein BH10PSE13_BH10PSE13_00190 [soil metagenome]
MLFEPIAEFLPEIRAQYAKISHELVNVAITETSGPVTMQVFRMDNDQTISHSAVGTAEVSKDSHREIPGISLDDWMAANDPKGPILLKIDIDGHEMQALRGAAKMLAHCSVIIIEVQSTALAGIIQFIQNAGFVLFDLVEPCYYDGYFWQADAILIRWDVHQNYFRPFTRDTFDGDKFTLFAG